jgi:fructose-bisphosphate aldolase class II
MIVTTAQLYKHAYGKYAVGAYNVNNMEQLLGLFRGCEQSQAPFITQLSKGARSRQRLRDQSRGAIPVAID